MKLKLLNIAVCRTPAFNLEISLEEKWEELKLILKPSSPTFYQLIAHVDKDGLSQLDEKIKYTIWKYFNRAKFRSTPFGAFAYISVIPVSIDQQFPIILHHSPKTYVFNDWTEVDKVNSTNLNELKASNWFLSNSTVYHVGDTVRYIRISNGVFEIGSINSFPELVMILNLCREKTLVKCVYDKMVLDFKLTKVEISKLLTHMVSLQLLLTEQSLNITGEDYFQRTQKNYLNNSTPYIISERKFISGGLNKASLTEVGSLINFLSKHLPRRQSIELKTFRDAFLKKFETSAVPLMTAMDFEHGIGFGDLGGHATEFQVRDLLSMPGPIEETERLIPYTGLHQFLINQLMENGPIQLDKYINDQQIEPPSLPNSLSVMLHFWQNQPVIENIGGCTANALLGRYTIAVPEIELFGRQIAAIEEVANQGILFFDVAYRAENKVDNVNRRKQLYQFELPILTWSCDSEPLSFDDILIAVRGKEIILYSKTHKKRMIPRIPSAYNYSRSDLAVFRLLCDLQHQEITSDLNFKLSYFFPNLSRYPRINYKNVIVSPACWLFPAEILKAIAFEKKIKGESLVRQWLHQEEIKFPFKCGHGDQTLCFDPEKNVDINAFLSYCIQHKNQIIYVTEALISDNEVTIGSEKKRHAAQFVLSYSHENQIYKPHELTLPINNAQTQRIIYPGQDWLYFEIYCHQSRVNSVLIDRIRKVLKANNSNINKWFFIRYEDPLPHIRLRLNLRDVSEAYTLITQLKLALDADLKSNVITDIQIKTYFREIERYGADSINEVEHLFFHDSDYVLKQLSSLRNANQLYVSTLEMMQQVLEIVIRNPQEQIDFVKTVAGGFCKELNLNTLNFKKLNESFKAINNGMYKDGIIQNKIPHRLKDAYKKLFTVGNTLNHTTLLADCFHMHINRLFNVDQRMHEGILYQYLEKTLISRRFRKSG